MHKGHGEFIRQAPSILDRRSQKPKRLYLPIIMP